MTVYEARRILGVREDVSFDVLKKTYRALVKKYHPDFNSDGEEMMKKINEAYDVLVNYEKENGFAQAKKQTYHEPKQFTEEFYNKHPRMDRGEMYSLIGWLIRTGRAKDVSDIWITRDFRVYLIKDLATSHLANIKKCIEEGRINISEYSEFYPKICKLLKERSAKVNTDPVTKKSKIILHF